MANKELKEAAEVTRDAVRYIGVPMLIATAVTGDIPALVSAAGVTAIAGPPALRGLAWLFWGDNEKKPIEAAHSNEVVYGWGGDDTEEERRISQAMEALGPPVDWAVFEQAFTKVLRGTGDLKDANPWAVIKHSKVEMVMDAIVEANAHKERRKKIERDIKPLTQSEIDEKALSKVEKELSSVYKNTDVLTGNTPYMYGYGAPVVDGEETFDIEQRKGNIYSRFEDQARKLEQQRRENPYRSRRVRFPDGREELASFPISREEMRRQKRWIESKMTTAQLSKMKEVLHEARLESIKQLKNENSIPTKTSVRERILILLWEAKAHGLDEFEYAMFSEMAKIYDSI